MRRRQGDTRRLAQPVGVDDSLEMDMRQSPTLSRSCVRVELGTGVALGEKPPMADVLGETPLGETGWELERVLLRLVRAALGVVQVAFLVSGGGGGKVSNGERGVEGEGDPHEVARVERDAVEVDANVDPVRAVESAAVVGGVEIGSETVDVDPSWRSAKAA